MATLVIKNLPEEIHAALPLLTLDRDFEAFRSAGLCLERLDGATES